jgi:N utilization substance protein A
MNTEFIKALEDIEKEKGVSKAVLLEALEAALISAYKKNFGSSQNVEVIIDPETGEVQVYALKEVTEDVYDNLLEVSLEDAQAADPKLGLGDFLRFEVTPKDFGRIAAQNAKQVVVQRIREAERDGIFNEYASRENEMITGVVQRVTRNNVLVNLGKTEGVLLPAEQMPMEAYSQGDRIKCFILEVKRTSKGPQIILSRTHPGLVKRLFELEVPEIEEGIVEIYGVAREAGSRTKLAVYNIEENIDPVGACVGEKGTRVKAIVEELSGEKIDIIEWSNDDQVFISNALSPSKVVSVSLNEEEKAALVVVPDYQLSLAIGKEGQNARLAAKLTGWKIDIKSESQMEAIQAQAESEELEEEIPMDEVESLETEVQAPEQEVE